MPDSALGGNLAALCGDWQPRADKPRTAAMRPGLGGTDTAVEASVRSVEELVLCPTAVPFPARAAARTCRVAVGTDEIVVRRRGRPCETVRLGGGSPGGVVAWLDTESRPAAHLLRSGQVTLTHYRGYLVPREVGATLATGAVLGAGPVGRDAPAIDVLGGGSTRALAVLPLECWTPGRRPPPAHLVRDARTSPSTAASTGADLLADSGLAEACARAGVPVRAVAQVDGLVPYEWARQTGVRPFVAGPELPRWIPAVRAVVLPAAIVATAFAQSLVGWTAAALAVPVLSVVQLGLLGLRDRRTRPAFDAVVEPQPGADVIVTRRFLSQARIAVTGREIVFVDGVGAERWHPLTGPTADPVAPLRRLADTAGIALAQQRVSTRPDPATGLATPVVDWSEGPRLVPVPWREAHRQLRRRRGMPAAGEDAYALAIALAVLLLPVAAAAAQRPAELVLASLTVVLWSAVHGFRGTARRFWFDRERRRGGRARGR